MSLPRFSIAVECSDHVTFFNRRKKPLNVVFGGRTTGGSARRGGNAGFHSAGLTINSPCLLHELFVLV